MNVGRPRHVHTLGDYPVRVGPNPVLFPYAHQTWHATSAAIPSLGWSFHFPTLRCFHIEQHSLMQQSLTPLLHIYQGQILFLLKPWNIWLTVELLMFVLCRCKTWTLVYLPYRPVLQLEEAFYSSYHALKYSVFLYHFGQNIYQSLSVTVKAFIFW